ncbi:MAG: M67 family metallopeptidase [Anaerolineales bacterium]
MEEILLSSRIIEQIENHLQSCLPEEGCGIVGGLNNQGLGWFPITNMLHSPSKYKMDPQEQLDAFLEIEKNQWEILGIVHSHPNTPPIPSETDIAEAYYPETVYLIFSPYNNGWRFSGYMIQNKAIKEVKIIIQE